MTRVPSFLISFTPPEIAQVQKSVADIMKTGQVNLGTYTEQFEQAFLPYSGCSYSVAVGTGTVALEMIFRILRLEGEEVLIQTNTNFATVRAAVAVGAVPKLYDCGLYPTLNEIKKRCTSKTKAVVVVHIGGVISPEMEEIAAYCKKHNLFLIEDAAHAHGSELNGKLAGSFGTAAAFSFYPTKVLTCGEGGLITTSDPELYKQALVYRDQGKDNSGLRNIVMGSSWRMSEFQAAVGLAHLNSFAGDTAARRELMQRYKNVLTHELISHLFPDPTQPSGYKYIIQLPTKALRDSLKVHLIKHGVGVSKGVYEVLIHQQPIFANLTKRNFPLAEYFAETHLCLPLWRHMTHLQQDYVIHVIKSWIAAQSQLQHPEQLGPIYDHDEAEEESDLS